MNWRLVRTVVAPHCRRHEAKLDFDTVKLRFTAVHP